MAPTLEFLGIILPRLKLRKGGSLRFQVLTRRIITNHKGFLQITNKIIGVGNDMSAILNYNYIWNLYIKSKSTTQILIVVINRVLVIDS